MNQYKRGGTGEGADPRDMPPGTKVWIYLLGKSQSAIKAQETTIMNLARQKGWVVDRVFCDDMNAGNSKNREQFALMVHLAGQKPRPADLIIIWGSDRFARSQVDSRLCEEQICSEWRKTHFDLTTGGIVGDSTQLVYL